MHRLCSRAVVTALALIASSLLGATVADAHVSDTRKVRVTIPTGVTSVRPSLSDFGKPTVIKEGDLVVAVEWEKPEEELLDADEAYDELPIRLRPGDVPFTQFVFNITQTCEPATGTPTVVEFFSDVQIVWRGNAAYSANPLVAAVIAGPADATPLDAEPAEPDASSALAPCLDRPGELARPPVGQLPCDLLPPGFGP